MLNDTIVRLIRTYVPILIGTAISYLPWLTDVINTEPLIVLTIAAYYTLGAWLETIHPAFGWLLGIPKTKTVE